MSKSIKLGKRFGAKSVVFVLTGDLLNSDRRPSEALTNENCRAVALLNAAEIIGQAIAHVNSEIPVEHVFSVMGNESRINKDLAQEAPLFVDNFDFIVHHMLKGSFAHTQIKFHDIVDPVEHIIYIHKLSLLITHGLSIAKMSPEKALDYMRKKHGGIEHVTCGHVHSPISGPGFSRSGGLPGANAFSEHGLAIPESTPSQVAMIVADGNIYPFHHELTYPDADTYDYTKQQKLKPFTNRTFV
jgi:predicted phosphodiesterase